MKSFLRKIICLFVPFLLLAGYTEYRLSGMETMMSYKKKAASSAAAETEMLILGSSHALSGINPAYFSNKAFNLANVSQSLYYDTELFSWFMAQSPKLKNLVVTVSYFTLDFSMLNSPENWRRYFYLRYFDIAPEGNESLSWWEGFDIRKYSLIGMYGVERSLKFLSHDFRNRGVSNIEESGWVWNPTDANKPLNDQEGKDRVRLHESIMREGLVDYNLAYLSRMADIADERGGRLFLVTTPAESFYAAHVDRERYSNMKTTLDKFCEEKDCVVLNYFQDSRFKDADFYDSDHLNRNGANKFSQILNRDIEKILGSQRQADDPIESR